MVSCQDLSSNGLLLNGIRIRKTCVLLRDGDTLQIGSRRKQDESRAYIILISACRFPLCPHREE